MNFVDLIIYFYLVVQSNIICFSPVIKTSLGPIMGNRKAYKGLKFDEFLGIPFAAPPVGNLRWKKSQPVTPWAPLIYDATKFSPHCTQFISLLYRFIGMGSKTSEDCLYLNIWLPVRSESSNNKLPIVLWVFGGGFILGTGEMYPGYLLALHSNAIVITFNYRVSSLGWLSTGDENMPGNYGLWDSHAVLNWIQDHIENFGGDPNSITSVGQSAGAAIVSHLMISSKTNKLIKNAMCFSGTSTGYFGISLQPLRLSLLLAELFGCPTTSTKAIEMCLRDIDARTLDFGGAFVQLVVEGRNPTLLPVIDGDFVAKHPKESFEEGAGKHVNLISGFLQDDAAGFVFQNPLGFPLIALNHSAASNESLWRKMRQWYGFLNNTDEIVSKIINKYPNMNTDDNLVRGKATTHAMTDAWFASSSNWESTIHSSFGQGRTYQYLFKHRQTFISTYENWINGSHTDELYSIFGPPYMKMYRKLIFRKDFTENDHKVNEHLMSYIANFVHTSDPNNGKYKVSTHWPTFDKNSQQYLELSASPRKETFHKNNTLERFKFHFDLPTHYIYSSQPSIPTTMTETDVDEALERMRHWLYSFLKSSFHIKSYKQKVDEMITEFQRKRLQILSTRL